MNERSEDDWCVFLRRCECDARRFEEVGRGQMFPGDEGVILVRCIVLNKEEDY